MKVGDLVKHVHTMSGPPGLVVDIIQKKCWPKDVKIGPMIDWRKVDPEPHAVILWRHNEGTIDVSIKELEVIND